MTPDPGKKNLTQQFRNLLYNCWLQILLSEISDPA